MRPILSAQGTYNYALARWLDEKIKPLSLNQYTISDIFFFSEDLRNTSLNESDIVVSYDVSSLFINVPLNETIHILVERAFKNNWFNVTHKLNIRNSDLVELLQVATKSQLFQFVEQVDGVATGSPFGPLVANAFLCSIEEQLQRENKLPTFYRRYVDDTLSSMPGIQSATTFLVTLNECHPSIHFTMEIADSNKLPFLGMMIEKKCCELVTTVYRKPTNNGLLLYFQSHVDMHYKKSLIRTMLHRAYRLSSTWDLVVRECNYLN